MNPPPRVDRKLLLFALCAAFLCIALVVHAGTLRRVKFVTDDDMMLDLVAGSLPRSIQWIRQAAEEQGRIGYYVSGWLFYAPYLTDSDTIRALLATSVQLLSLIAVGVFVGRYTAPAVSILFLLLAYGFMPHWWQHFPIAAYPVIYHAGLLLLFAGLSVYVAACRGPGPSGRRPVGALVTGLGLIFLSMCLYEAMTCVGAMLCGWVVYAEAPEPRVGLWDRFIQAIRAHWPLLFTIVLYLGVYVSFRAVHPSRYAGSTVDSGSLMNLERIGLVVWLFGLGGLPGIDFFWQSDLVSNFSLGSIARDGVLRFVANNVTAYGLIGGCAFAWIVIAIGRNMGGVLDWCDLWVNRRAREWFRTSGLGNCGRLLRAASAGVVLAFLLQLPLGVSVKYQNNTREWAPCITSYYSYVAFSVALACLWVFVFRASRKLRVVWFHAIVGFAGCAAAALFVLNAVASSAVIRSQEDHYAKWRLVGLLAASDMFRNVSDNGFVVAPSLWQGIAPGREEYWSEYIARHFKKRLRVVQSAPAVKAGLPKESLYYLRVDAGTEPDNATLLFGLLRTTSSILVSDKVYLFGWRDFKREYLSYVTTDPSIGCGVLDLSGQISGCHHIAPISPGTRTPGGFISQVDVAAASLDSAAVITRVPETAAARMVDVLFERGFSGYESLGATYWRWSDGPSGEGVIAIENRTQVPLRVRFAAQMMTGRAEPVDFAVAVAGKTANFTAGDGQVYSKDLVLDPGRTEIAFHCFAGRLPVPDPRYLVFGLKNWSIADIGSAGLADNLNITKPGKDVELVFQGFSGLEQQGSTYWRWSDGSSGIGVLKFVNHAGRPVQIVFEGTITDGYVEMARCDIVYDNKRQTLLVNNTGARVSLRLTVPVGGAVVTVKTSAPRVNAPDDPRYMVFAIRDWRVLIE